MSLAQLGEQLTTEAHRVVQGQALPLQQLVVCLLSGGHALLEGVPGIAKTLLAKTVAHITGLEFKRVQFTPDLMPSDITGTNIYEAGTGSFRLRKGPVFTQILLADEINRTPPKTQAALLQAMQEHTVTIDGVDHPLPQPFFVVATQNPVEYEGTYPLPEAQLDRFLMKIVMTYPSAEEEIAVLRQAHAGFDAHALADASLTPVTSAESLLAATAEAQKITVDDKVFGYITEIVRRTREAYGVTLGASPRASLSLLRCGKVLAALQGRDYVVPDDIKVLAPPILRHRLLLRPEAELEGFGPDQVIASVLNAVPVPR
jgi:MoxR-like ATPase